MQCHGGLKGPLRRIIRSLGNDSVGSSCRSYPQRHLTAREIHSPPAPEQCDLGKDRRQRRATPDASCRHSDAPAALICRSSRGYATQRSPLVSHSEPQRKEDSHDDRKPGRLGRAGETPHKPNAVSFVDAGTSPATCKSPSPSGRSVMKRFPIDAPIKDGQDFSERYRANVRRVEVGRKRSQYVARQIQQERHGYESSEDWRVVLRMLDDNTEPGQQLYKKMLETVKLPEGMLARFRRNVGVSLREIMEQTGCHVQVSQGLPHCSNNADAFAILDLLGSSRQIKHALEVLPQYLDVMPREEMVGTHGNRNLNDHFLDRRIRSDEDMRLVSLSIQKTDMQSQHDSLYMSGVERVVNELDQEEDSSASASAKAPMRSVFAEDRTPHYNMYNALDERPRSFSNALEVSAYVADLCRSMPGVAHRAMYKTHIPFSQRGHVEIVTKKLVSLFSDSGFARMATSYTVNRAISYLTKHNNFAAFRGLYRALEDGGLVFTVSNWNFCLAAAAKAGDVHNFRYTLKVMLRHGVKPDPVTWTTFHGLMCHRFPLSASLVVDIMHNKGMLYDHQAAKMVAQNAVTNDLKAHLALRGSLATFYKLYDNRFSLTYGLTGFKWLGVDVANRMCAVLLSLGRSHSALEILHEFRQRNGESAALETVTLNTFLTSSLRDIDPGSAVAMLQHFEVGKPGALVPNNITYAILFSIAWQRRYFNMLRVIWRYACMSGHHSYSMRFRIMKNLNTFLEEDLSASPNLSRNHIWRAFAAKFAVGITGELRRDKDLDEVASDTTPLNSLETQMLRSGYLNPNSLQDEERRKFFHDVVTDDIAEASLSRPALPLAELLHAAWEKDRDWKKRGLGLPKTYSKDTFREMLEDGLQVPIEAGDGTLELRSWEVPSLLRQNHKTEGKNEVVHDGEENA